MPDAVVVDPTDTAAPSADQATDAGTSAEPTLESLVGSFDKPPAGKEEGDSVPPPDKGAKPPEDKKPDMLKKDPAADKGPGDKDQPTPKLIHSHKELQKKVKTEYEPEIARLRKEVEELKSRKPEAPEMKEFETVKQERERLQREVAELDYSRSEDFKRDFLVPRKAIYDEAVQNIGQLTVRYAAGKDPETGEPIVKERRAVKEDFDAVLELPIAQQQRAIDDWFGRDANTVRDYVRDINRNLRDARLAIQRHAQERDVKQSESAKKQQQEAEQYNKTIAAQKQALEEKWPHWFKLPPTEGDNADPELAEAHQGGIEMVKQLIEEGPNMPPEKRASYAAVVLARAESWPRLVVENKRLTAELQAFKDKAKAKVASDPGSGGSGTGGGGTPEPDDIAAMAAKFDQR